MIIKKIENQLKSKHFANQEAEHCAKEKLLKELSKENLLYGDFTISSGFRKSYRGCKN